MRTTLTAGLWGSDSGFLLLHQPQSQSAEQVEVTQQVTGVGGSRDASEP